MAWVHRLSNIDPLNRTAICANCGPTQIRKRRKGPDGSTAARHWRCIETQHGRHTTEAERAHRREYFHRWNETHRSGRPWLKHRGDKCSRCGFVPEDICQLDTHHINEDHRDNSPENLVTLCANCHRLLHKSKRVTA